jgi:hypothetical protein
LRRRLLDTASYSSTIVRDHCRLPRSWA